MLILALLPENGEYLLVHEDLPGVVVHHMHMGSPGLVLRRHFDHNGGSFRNRGPTHSKDLSVGILPNSGYRLRDHGNIFAMVELQ